LQLNRPDYTGANRYAIDRLERELPPNLYYHNLYHTCEDILPAAERLARHEGVSRAACGLLLTACYFHDLGFTVSPIEHEATSASIAAQVLPNFGFSALQIKIIQGCILVTKVFTPPRSLLEAIIVDADLDVLGRPDFHTRSAALRREQAELGQPTTDEQWLRQQRKFFDLHVYRTISAQALRCRQKQQNRRELDHLLSQLAPSA
jgi:predicted metal-dependent HD superfamily phosphohydrolase